MDKKRIFIGVDGGGTRTTASAFDESGRFLSEVTGGSVNFRALGMEKARRNMAQIIGLLSDRLKVSRFHSVFIGMSALSERASETQLSDFCSGIINAEYLQMDSDLFIALAGMQDTPCVFVISGTGSMAAAKAKDGRILTSGGWGHILGDEGSGYDIGLGGIKKAIRAYEGLETQTALTEKMMSFFGIEHPEKLLEIFYDSPIEKSRIARFAREVALCAEEGDEISLSLLRQAACELSLNALSLIEKTGSRSVGIYGGVFSGSPLYRELFTSCIHNAYPGVRVDFPALVPCLGAVKLAFAQAGAAFDESVIGNIKKTYTDGART